MYKEFSPANPLLCYHNRHSIQQEHTSQHVSQREFLRHRCKEITLQHKRSSPHNIYIQIFFAEHFMCMGTRTAHLLGKPCHRSTFAMQCIFYYLTSMIHTSVYKKSGLSFHLRFRGIAKHLAIIYE